MDGRFLSRSTPGNFDYVTKLGATRVFDYNSRTVRADIKRVLEGARFAGALALEASSATACIDIAAASKGRRFVVFGTYPSPFKSLSSRLTRWDLITKVAPAMLAFGLNLAKAARRRKNQARLGQLAQDNEVSGQIYGDFLPRALEANAYVAALPARVVRSGLETIQAALDLQRSGVGAKIVVTL